MTNITNPNSFLASFRKAATPGSSEHIVFNENGLTFEPKPESKWLTRIVEWVKVDLLGFGREAKKAELQNTLNKVANCIEDNHLQIISNQGDRKKVVGLFRAFGARLSKGHSFRLDYLNRAAEMEKKLSPSQSDCNHQKISRKSLKDQPFEKHNFIELSNDVDHTIDEAWNCIEEDDYQKRTFLERIDKKPNPDKKLTESQFRYYMDHGYFSWEKYH